MGCSGSKTGLDDYQNATKETYRGWWVNRACERLWYLRHPDVPHPSFTSRAMRDVTTDAVVLYLVGPDDVDRNVLLRRGFQSKNLIAIDVCDTYVKRVRRNGGCAIQGNLWEILAAWPDDWKVDVLHADLCGGFTKPSLHLAESLMSFEGCSPDGMVVSLNLMRGRDRVRAFGSVQRWLSQYVTAGLTKHRSLLWLMYYWGRLMQEGVVCADDETLVAMWRWGIPALMSYPSKRVIMDAAVALIRAGGCLLYDEHGDKLTRFAPNGRMTPETWQRRVKRMRRCISAQKAIRTMRENVLA